jgi:hypothetical protein
VLWTDLNTSKVETLLAEHDKSKPLCLLVCSHSPHVFWMDNQGYDPAKSTSRRTSSTRRRPGRCGRSITPTSRTWTSQLGDVLASMKKHDFIDNTLTIFTADQGAQWPMSKWTLYDAGIRAPLIVRWPGKAKPSSTSGALVSLIDILPTMLEAAGGTLAKDLDAKSFLGVIKGDTETHRDATFALNTGDKDMNRSPARAVRTAKYKYILNLLPQDIFKTHITDAGGEDGLFYWRSWEKLAAAATCMRRKPSIATPSSRGGVV